LESTVTLQQGDRIEITEVMPDDPNPIPAGSRGTVRRVTNQGTSFEQIDVDWDEPNRRLMLLPELREIPNLTRK
jgi:hypothetical protein